MFESEKHLSLSDLIDLKLLQEFQDNFAKAMGVASITVDAKGPVTRPSHFTDFCTKYTRGSALGYKKCVECDIHWGKIAAERGEPVIYDCHTGLTDFAVPIIVNGMHIGSILGGQVLTQKPDEKHFRQVAKELGLDEDEYIEALSKIKIVPRENIEAAARLLYLMANAISEIGHKNLELFKKNKTESLYRIIMGTINATLDMHETKKRIVNIIGQTLHADRCFIVEYDKKTDKFLSVNDEYLSSKSIDSYREVDVNKECPNITSLVKRGKQIIFDSKRIKSKELQILADEEPSLKANLGIPLHYGNELLGSLVVHYIEKDHTIVQDEINLLTAIAAQISAVIYQEKLYKDLKSTAANQSAILRNMPFMAWLKDEKGRLLAVNEPYAEMCKTTIKNVIGKTDFDFFPKEHAQAYIDDDNRVMETVQTIQTEEIIEGPDGTRCHETIKSPVLDYKGNVVGTVGIARDISEKKASELEMLSKQKQILKANEREKFIGNIISKALSTFDINLLKQIVVEIGAMTKADRCYFVEADIDNLKGKPIEAGCEYRSSTSIKSITGYEFPFEDIGEFVEVYNLTKDLASYDYEEIAKSSAQKYDGIKKYVKQFNVKSAVGIPIMEDNELKAVLVIEYVNNKVIHSEEFLNFLRILGNQFSMAYNQIHLYQETKKRAERETLLRKTIEIMRLSDNLDSIKREMTSQIGKFTNADRVVFADYNHEKGSYFVCEENEYRSSKNVVSFIGYDFAAAPGFNKIVRKEHLSGRDIIFSDLDKYIKENNLKDSGIEDFYRKTGFLSSMAVNISHGEAFYGNLVISFGEKRKICEDEISFIKSLASQAGIAIFQSDINKKEKEAARNQKFLSEVIMSAVEAKTPEEIIKTIVTHAGEFFAVDRCFYVKYDYSKRAFLPAEKYSEYNSSKNIRKMSERPFTEEESSQFAEFAIEQRQSWVVNNIYEEPMTPAARKVLGEYGIKSFVLFPVFHQDTALGMIAINSVNTFRNFKQTEVDILATVVNQMSIILHQANLNEQLRQKPAEKINTMTTQSTKM